MKLPLDYGQGAHFSPCRTWRYALWRLWHPQPEKPLVLIGLNPSTADEHKNDPTVSRCIALAQRESLDGLIMLNLFGLRSTDPKGMLTANDPAGPYNVQTLTEVCWHYHDVGSPIVAAWGCHGQHMLREDWAVAALPPLECLGKTKHGHPKHPLYLRADVEVEPYTREGRRV